MSRTDTIKEAIQSRFSKNRNGNKVMYGLSQKRFQSSDRLLPGNPSMKRYKVKPDKVTSITSGSFILSIGLAFAFTSQAINANDNQFILSFLFQETNSISGIIYMFSLILFQLVIDPFSLIPSFIFGWFIGGLISSFIYKREGSKGPIYSSYLAISFSVSLLFIIGLLFYNGVFNYEEGSFGQLVLGLTSLMTISLAISIISIPLAIVAWVGYKIGGYFAKI